MRLINCSTLRLEEFIGTEIPRYAILSHTWDGGEVSFADLTLRQATASTRAGYQKIVFTCKQARRDGLGYAWIDTCCIDKSSSSELSEAINSMFTWYKDAIVCYAYLSDVSKATMVETFASSRWFTRGWTLQELLAPSHLIFYDRNWIEMGTKQHQANWLFEITGIDAKALIAQTDVFGDAVGFGSFCVAKRMSWASNRTTTRVEDTAYCLLGMFDVNMPLLYGEGDRAFRRLQEEIIKNIDDDSILAWGLEPRMDDPQGQVSDSVAVGMTSKHISDILASSPKDFAKCANLRRAAASTSPFTVTNLGLQIQLPLVPVSLANEYSVEDFSIGWIGLLSCSTGSSSEFLGIPFCPAGSGDGSSIRVTRTHIDADHYPYNTLVVGSRSAVRSKLETITISRHIERNGLRGNHQGYRQIVVNEGRTLQSLQYKIHSGTAWFYTKYGRTLEEYEPVWYPETKILIIEGENMTRDIMEFCFMRSQSDHSPFTIFMRTDSHRAISREGFAFSEDDRRRFYDYLGDESRRKDVHNVVIDDSYGNLFQVSIGIHVARVYGHRMFEVNVDLVQITSDDGS
jgi:hypothetical protein